MGKTQISCTEFVYDERACEIANGYLYLNLLYLLVNTHAVIGQFSGPYSPVRPAKN